MASEQGIQHLETMMKTTPESRALIANTVRCYPGELAEVGNLLSDFEEEHAAAEHWRALHGHIRDCDGGDCNTAQEAIELFDASVHALIGIFDVNELRVYRFRCDGEEHLIAARGIAEACAIFWQNCTEYDPAPNGEHRGELPAIRHLPKRKWEQARIRDEDVPGGVTTVAEMLAGDPTPGLLGSTLE